GNAMAKGQLRTPFALMVVAIVLLLLFTTVSRKGSATFQAVVQPPAVAQAQPAEAVKAAAKTKPPVPADAKYPSWRIETNEPDEWQVSASVALDKATQEILADLTQYLRSQQPPVEWTPPDAYVRDLIKKSAKLEDKKSTSGDFMKYRYVGSFELT